MNNLTETFNSILDSLGIKSKTERKFLTATEAFQASLSKKKVTKIECLKSMIKTVEESITYDINSSSPSKCIVKEYSSLREKELLPEVASHFQQLEYDVTLLAGEKYPETNLLIINYQNRTLFPEDVEE